MDAVTFFKWYRAAELLTPILFKSLDDNSLSSLTRVEVRKQHDDDNDEETFATWTPEGLAVDLGFKEGWIRVWCGNTQIEGKKAQKHLYKHSKVSISFTDKGITDIASLMYGYDEIAQQQQ